jgi:ATP-dependent Clp protease ATP-binding subunit ClpC
MATNDPFGDFRSRRGSLFDEFFSEFFDRPFGMERATSPTGTRTSAPPARRPVEQVDITQFFSDATRELLQRAAQLALDWGSLDLDTEHLLWAAMQDDLVAQIVRHADGDPAAIAAQVEDEAERGGRTDVAPSLSPEAKGALLRAYDEMRELNSSYLGPEHVLLALARDTESDAGRLLGRFGLSHTALRGAVIRGVTQTDQGGRPASQTKTLDEYSRDLSEAARQGKLDPVIGRGDEIEETIEILSRRTKNNPVLIGDPGVGKTAIAEGIAQRIVNDEVPETLAGKRLVVLDLAGMVAGTKYRGEFEDRLKSVIDEVTDHGDDLILFIDDARARAGAAALPRRDRRSVVRDRDQDRRVRDVRNSGDRDKGLASREDPGRRPYHGLRGLTRTGTPRRPIWRPSGLPQGDALLRKLRRHAAGVRLTPQASPSGTLNASASPLET